MLRFIAYALGGVYALLWALWSAAAYAQTAVVAATTGTPIDLTTIITALIGASTTIAIAVATAVINSRMKDSDAKDVLTNAVKNSLGAMQQAATTAVGSLKPKVVIPGVSPALADGVQYVLDHAGDEAKRLGVTPQAIAEKIDAQVGLAVVAKSYTAVPTTPEAVARSKFGETGPFVAAAPGQFSAGGSSGTVTTGLRLS